MKTARQTVLFMLVLWPACLLALGQPATVTGVEAVGFTVSDMDRSIDFYAHVLHFAKLSDDERAGANLEHLKGVFGARVRVVRMSLGDEVIELTEFVTPRGRPIPADVRSNDLSFQHIAVVVSDMPRAFAWLRQNHVRSVSSAPQTLPAWNKQAAGIEAFYFNDPDGHVLEIIHFPSGKGDPRWQRTDARLFEGIDHTAIAVEDTGRSIAFYRDQLGMRVAGESENYGEEQEHLNSVFGARLRITSLRAPQGPGVELLEYLVPRSGRQILQDAQAADIAHWETIVDVADPHSAWKALREKRTRFVSSDVLGVDEKAPAAHEGFLLQDPDGHVVMIENAARQNPNTK